LQRDVRLVIVVEQDLPFADHRPSGLTFVLLDTGELWVSDGEFFGPLDALACVLLEQAWPGLVGPASDALTAWWFQERRSWEKRNVNDDELDALFVRAAGAAREELAS